MLRELAWCRLEAPGRFFLHFGFDYYMFAGNRADLPGAVAEVRLQGLFVFVALGIVSFSAVLAFSTTRPAWRG